MKKMKLYGLAGVAALAAIGGTFAYYASTTDFNNQFDTTNYSTSTTEQFNPNGNNKDWKPGVTVDKKVYAMNTGDGDVWVRIKFDEAWFKQEAGKGFAEGTPLEFADGKQGFGSADGLEKFGVEGNTTIDKELSNTHQGGRGEYSVDGLVNMDTGSVVLKTFAADWGNDWYFEGGYFYYKKALKKGEATPALLEAVTLCDDTDMGAFDNPEFYISVAKGTFAEPDFPIFPEAEWKKDKDATTITSNNGEWVKGVPTMTDDEIKELNVDVFTYKGNILDDTKPGYANADYKLDITVEFLQTNEDGSIASAEGWDEDIVKQLIANGSTAAPEVTE